MYNWFQGLYPQFCSQIKNPKQQFSASLTNKDFKMPSSKRWHRNGYLEGRTPPPSAGSYADYKFDFDWKPSDGSCWHGCNDAFYHMSQSPCGHDGGEMNAMALHTEFDVGCGTYSYTITPPPPPPPPPPPVTCEPGQTTPAGSIWHCDPNQSNCRTAATQPDGKSSYEAAIHQFCYGGYKWVPKPGDELSAANYFWFDTTTIDPSTGLPTYCIGAATGTYQQWSPASAKNCKAHAGGLMNSNSKVSLMIRASPDKSGCPATPQNHNEVDGDSCKQTFMNVINQCETLISSTAFRLNR